MHPLALQGCPKQWVLHAATSPFEIHKGCEEGLFLELGAVDEMTQGEELVLCGHGGTESGLSQGSEPTLLRPADNALIEDGLPQTAEGLPDRYGPVVGWIRPVTFLAGVELGMQGQKRASTADLYKRLGQPPTVHRRAGSSVICSQGLTH